MKRFFILLMLIMFSGTVFAKIPVRTIKNPPQGTFKKTRTGKIVQYDKNGKKIGTYKINNGKYIQIK